MKIFLATSCAVLVLLTRPSFAGSEDEVKAILDRFVLAQNAHDIASVRDLLVDSPTFLYLARGGPVWGREAALKRYEALYQGTWKLDPDNSGLKVVLLNDTTAQLLIPMLVSQGPAGQPVPEAPFLINLTLVRNATEWRIASVLPFPIPTKMPDAEAKLSLTPTGKLRVAFLANNAAQATKDSVTGELKGPAVDLGRQLAMRLGVVFEAVPYRSVAEIEASAPKGEWDVISLGINSNREKLIDFTAPYSQTESGYLVKGSAISTMAQVDGPGIRIAVVEKGDSDIFLTKSLKHANLIRTKSLADAVELLKSGSADVHANLKTFLIPLSAQIPSGRILDGYWQIQPIALGVPKGKEASARYVRQVVDELKSQGFVMQSIERAAVPGLMPAP